jgi:NAD(P)-dependent dehydrogenase (short-subunit alcohol dehydrogenase family)
MRGAAEPLLHWTGLSYTAVSSIVCATLYSPTLCLLFSVILFLFRRCLVNNAGVMMLAALSDQAPEEWDTMISVNIKGALILSHNGRMHAAV